MYGTALDVWWPGSGCALESGGASLAQCFKCEAISLPGTALVESWNHHHPHPTAADLPEQIGLDWIGLDQIGSDCTGLLDCPKRDVAGLWSPSSSCFMLRLNHEIPCVAPIDQLRIQAMQCDQEPSRSGDDMSSVRQNKRRHVEDLKETINTVSSSIQYRADPPNAVML